ncbi:MAG: hypothetical protein DMF84_08880 [Acidobacteria bacterium]|nr:MAG: hypothetical protein DMF84_08880 [Acidobacteriota bacterium]
MRHLSPSEFVDLADGALDAARAAHLERCDACRAQAHALRMMMRDAGTDAPPEPSPLFWDHFQQGVQRAIATEPSPRRSWFVLRPMPAFASVMIVSIAIASAALYPRRAHDAPLTPPADVAMVPAAPPATDPGEDPAWMVLRDVASDMAIEDAHAAGITLRPGEAENAVLQLTPAERNEFGRLLQDALKHAGA